MMMRGEEGRAMEVYFVEDKSSIAPLFDGWAQTMIWSCLQNCMGIAYVDHPTAPQAAQISIGDLRVSCAKPCCKISRRTCTGMRPF